MSVFGVGVNEYAHKRDRWLVAVMHIGENLCSVRIPWEHRTHWCVEGMDWPEVVVGVGN